MRRDLDSSPLTAETETVSCTTARFRAMASRRWRRERRSSSTSCRVPRAPQPRTSRAQPANQLTFERRGAGRESVRRFLLLTRSRATTREARRRFDRIHQALAQSPIDRIDVEAQLGAGLRGEARVRAGPVSYTHLTLPTSDLV